VFCESGVAVDDVRFPEDGRQVLWSTSNGGHSECFLVLVVWIIKVVLALSEVDDLHFVVRKEEEVGGFDIAVANALALQEGTSSD
jgi:hypothetical protein